MSGAVCDIVTAQHYMTVNCQVKCLLCLLANAKRSTPDICVRAVNAWFSHVVGFERISAAPRETSDLQYGSLTATYIYIIHGPRKCGARGERRRHRFVELRAFAQQTQARKWGF